MKIIRFADLAAVPWKNGGGVTREIARLDIDGAMCWRLSIADVASEGPFSKFAGMQRILTVIEGASMQLERDDGGTLIADILVPVRFTGDEAVNGLLPHGPCRDFNVIWNPFVVAATVQIAGSDTPPIFDASGDVYCGLLCVSKSLELSGLANLTFADFVALDSSDAPISIVDGTALLVRISAASKP
ncbi:MAG: HutD family protein [Rhizobiaceae bacterium]